VADLKGRRILLVEDSPVVSNFAVSLLEELGCMVVGPAPNMAVARDLAISEPIEAAIIDIRIRGEKAFPICDILDERGIPFVLTSGYADWSTPAKWRDCCQLPKPYKLEDVELALSQLLS
jgi:DNA-binding response OmpR family regulator